MQKSYNKNLFVLLPIFLIFILPIVIAQETSENPGITPDSFLWGIDKALEQISLLLATSPGEKATKRLEIAQERLAEIKEMIKKDKLEAAKKAEESHGKTLTQILQDIKEIEKENSTEEIEEVIEIEKELHDHDEEVDQVFGELKIKIKIEGELTQAQQDLIDSILNNLKGQTGEVEIEIKIKKDKIKIKIKIETGKSDEEVEDEIEKLEIRAGLGKIKVRAEIFNGKAEVKLKIKFFTNITERSDIVQEIINKFALDNETADAALKIEEEEEDERLEEKFKVKVKVKEDRTKVEVELKFILNTTDRESILDAIVERSQLTAQQIEDAIEFKVKEDEEELEIEVEIEDGVAEVEVEFNGEEFEFTLETTDRDAIIDEIIERTGLTREKIEEVIEFEIEDDDEEEDDEEEEEPEVNETETNETEG